MTSAEFRHDLFRGVYHCHWNSHTGWALSWGLPLLCNGYIGGALSWDLSTFFIWNNNNSLRICTAGSKGVKSTPSLWEKWQRRRHKYHRNLNDIIIKRKRDDPGLTAPAASNVAWQKQLCHRDTRWDDSWHANRHFTRWGFAHRWARVRYGRYQTLASSFSSALLEQTAYGGETEWSISTFYRNSKTTCSAGLPRTTSIKKVYLFTISISQIHFGSYNLNILYRMSANMTRTEIQSHTNITKPVLVTV